MAGCRRARWQLLGVVGQEVGGGVGGSDSKGDGAGRGGREPDGAGAVGAKRDRWSTREELAGYWRARRQFLWVVGQEGGWQGARWGRGSGGSMGQMAGEGGEGRL